MTSRPLVTIVGATGAQGGAVLRSLVQTGKYKIRALTRDPAAEKAQALKRLNDDIEIVKCDVTKSDDVQRAFKDSWAIYALTDYWAQPDQPEVEMQQGILMADTAASLNIPYYIFSTLEDPHKISHGKLEVRHCTQKAQLRDYITEKHPKLKSIFVEPAVYIQNWTSFAKTTKLADGTIVFSLPVDQKAKLHFVDIDDTGPIVREILENPDQFVGQDICICSEEISFEDVPKIFTKVTGIPAIAKTLTEEEFRENIKWLSKNAQDDLFYMYKFFEEYGCYGKKDWTTGKKLTKLTTWEEWLKKTGWKGE